MSYDVSVMAVNRKGKSSPVMLQGYTVKSPEKQTGMQPIIKMMSLSCHVNSFNKHFLLFYSFLAHSFTVVFPFSDFSPGLVPTFLQIKPFLGTLLGIFGALLLILSAIILVVRLKSSSRRDRTRASQISNTITMSSTLSPSLQNGILLREASADSIDKNPDIIPQGTSSFVLLFPQGNPYRVIIEKDGNEIIIFNTFLICSYHENKNLLLTFFILRLFIPISSSVSISHQHI